MDRLIAQDAALQQCFKFSEAQDSLNKDLFLSLFEPGKKATLDMSKHIPHMPVSEFTPEEFWMAVSNGMSGFTATHHQLGNPIFKCDQSLQSISIRAKITAYHCINGDGAGALESVTARATQTMDLRKSQGKWVISRVAVERDAPLDSPELYVKAQDRAESGKGRVAFLPA